MHQLNLFQQYGKISIVSKLSTRMKYTIKDLRADFPDDAACLKWLVEYLYPDGIFCRSCDRKTKHYPIKGRKVYSCSGCGHHVSPTAGTIFHKSRTPLTDWFYAIYLMSSNKAGTSAKQIERELGCTYKTAWRMMHQIRKMMEAPDDLLSGDIEVDETYLHPNTFKRSSARRRYGFDARRTGEVIFGIVQRGGMVKVWHVRAPGTRVLLPLIQENVRYGSTVHSDGWNAYKLLPKRGYEHKTTNHSAGIYVDGDNYTQNIENVWSHFKRGIKGVYRHIGKTYVQAYANEYAWRYSNRKRASMFWALMCQINKKYTT
jgi:transposase